MIDETKLRRLIEYDADSGMFTWRVRRGAYRQGDHAGGVNRDCHWQIQIGGQRYLGHELAWFFAYGEWPKRKIVHVHGRGVDNTLTNLVEAGVPVCPLGWRH